jgi:hypothetical protein
MASVRDAILEAAADLLDRAERNAVDTAGWVPEVELSVAASNCA